MRIITDNNGWVYDTSSEGASIDCEEFGTCIEYEGTIPEGYDTIEEWEATETAEGRLNAWKIVSGSLVYDVAKQTELEELWEKQNIDNSPVLHKDLYEIKNALENIQDVSSSQYKQETATGKLIELENVKKVFPIVKFTSLGSKIDLIVNGKNMLPNEATTQNINGVEFTQNADRTITLFGKATAPIEYNIAGSSTNTEPIMAFKKNENYYLSSNSLTIKMYSYDGTNRTEVYSGTGGAITFTDADKTITQIVLSIPTGSVFMMATISLMLNYGTTAETYETYKKQTISIVVSNSPTYVEVSNGVIYACVDGEETIIGEGNVNIFDGYNILHTIQDTNIEITYCINNLALEGTTTNNNKFIVHEDGTVEMAGATINGGTLVATSGGYSESNPYISVNNGSGTEPKGSTLFEGGISVFDYHTDSPQAYVKVENSEGGLSLEPNGLFDTFGVNLLKPQSVLWQGSSYMNSTQTADLSENISDQRTGIVLVWSAYASGSAQNYQWVTHFVSKKEIELSPGLGHNFLLNTETFSYVAGKYLYISDNKITGNANNDLSGTGSSISYNNAHWVLRYVIGV